MLFLNDLGIFAVMDVSTSSILKQDELARMLAVNRGLDPTKFIKTAEEMEAEMKAAQERQAQMELASATAQNAGTPAKPIA